MAEETVSPEPKPDRWYNITLGSSFKESHSSSKVCSLRYDFIPGSLDKSQPGELHKGKDNLVTVEYLNIQRDKPKLTFKGVSEDYKENDAVLIFDGESFRLERLHRSVKRLRRIRIPGESEPSRPKPVEPRPTVQVQVEQIEIENRNEKKPTPKDSDENMSIDPPRQAEVDEEIADVDISDDEAQRGPSAAEALRAQVNAEVGSKRPSSSSSGSDSSGSESDSSSSGSDTSDADSVLSV